MQVQANVQNLITTKIFNHKSQDIAKRKASNDQQAEQTRPNQEQNNKYKGQTIEH